MHLNFPQFPSYRTQQTNQKKLNLNWEKFEIRKSPFFKGRKIVLLENKQCLAKPLWLVKAVDARWLIRYLHTVDKILHKKSIMLFWLSLMQAIVFNLLCFTGVLGISQVKTCIILNPPSKKNSSSIDWTNWPKIWQYRPKYLKLLWSLRLKKIILCNFGQF